MLGHYNYGYRDYDPMMGRFATVDPVRDGRNWYVYTANDPVNFIDPWGLAAEDEAVGFTGSKMNVNFFTVSAIVRFTYAAGTVAEYRNGETVNSYGITQTSFGLETNAGVEVGHTWSSYPDATKSDILGKSVSGETQWSWGLGITLGTDRTDSGKNSTEISPSVGFSALPTTGSLDFNTTRESTYDYKSAVKTLHSSEELDSWIVGA